MAQAGIRHTSATVTVVTPSAAKIPQVIVHMDRR